MSLYAGLKSSLTIPYVFFSASETGAILGFPHDPDRFSATTILARVGISLISEQQACSNGEEEIPKFDFERVRNDARAEWNELLNRVQVDTEGVDLDTTILFYSSVRPFLLLLCLVRAHAHLLALQITYGSRRLYVQPD